MSDDPFEAWVLSASTLTYSEWMEEERARELRAPHEDRLRQMYLLQNSVWGQAFPQQGALTRNAGLGGALGGLGGMLGGGLGQWRP